MEMITILLGLTGCMQAVWVPPQPKWVCGSR